MKVDNSKNVRIQFDDYIKNERIRTFYYTISYSDLKTYLDVMKYPKTTEEFLKRYTNGIAELLYLYAADDDRVLREEYVYCDNFKKKYNDYLLSVEYKDHPLSQEEYYEKYYDESCYSDDNKSIDVSSLVDYVLE